MARNYAPLPHDYLEEMSPLDDAEFGRLCRALLRYSRDGVQGELSGLERILWPRAKSQEDRFQASYDAAVEQKRQAGKKSAEVRRAARKNDVEHCSTALNGVEQESTDASKTNKTETETETETKPSPTEKGNARKHPTIEMVTEYARIRGRPELAKPFFDYYAAAKWRDAENKPVYNWQQKFVAWEMREDQKAEKRNVFPGAPASRPQTRIDPKDDIKRMEKYMMQMREMARETGG